MPEKSFGEYLKEVRLEKGLGVLDVSDYIKIKGEFLHALEREDFSQLPSPVYAKGFLKKYASFLGIEKEVMSLYRQKMGETKNEKRVTPFDEKWRKKKAFFFTPLRMIIGLVILGTLALFSYLYIQVDTLLAAPQLEITSPQSGTKVKRNYVEIQGKTDFDAVVEINEKEIELVEEGYFRERIDFAENGLQNITVRAINKLSKKETVENIVVDVNSTDLDLQYSPAPSEEISEGDLSLQIRVVEDTWFQVETDGEKIEFSLPKGESKLITADQKIVLKSGKAYATYISFNEEEEKIMGSGGVLTRVWGSNPEEEN